MVTTRAWRGSPAKRLLGSLAYPVFLLLNRPTLGWLSRAMYDFALRANGIAINFPGRHGINQNEEKFLRRIAGRIQSGVLIDVGANHGAYARVLRQIAPAATIYAFEPHPRTFTDLRARIGDAVRVINQALSDTQGTLRLYDFAAGDGSTQASLSSEAVRFFDPNVVSHEVAVSTLDDFMGRERITEIAFLKIDTEGFDLAVLKGARKALSAKRIHIIQFEFIPANIVTGATMRGFFEALDGYDIYRLCLNGSLARLWPYDVKRCEIFVTHNLVAMPSHRAPAAASEFAAAARPPEQAAAPPTTAAPG